MTPSDEQISELRGQLILGRDIHSSPRQIALAQGYIDTFEALLADRDLLVEQRDNEAWMHAACLTIAETGEKWGDRIIPSLAMQAVYRLRQDRDRLAKRVKELKKIAYAVPPNEDEPTGSTWKEWHDEKQKCLSIAEDDIAALVNFLSSCSNKRDSDGCPVFPEDIWEDMKSIILQPHPGTALTQRLAEIEGYIESRRKTIKASIAAEVLSGNTVKESNERTALAELEAFAKQALEWDGK